jgi:predicted RNA binding protein YcfA (HicA-like mRNA interferase family)
MTKRDKLVDRIRQRPPEADFDDVRAVLEMYGWAFDRQKGSHATFTKAGEHPLTIPITHHVRVKRFYLGRICEALGLNDEEIS